jgi:hypothetical protein
MISEVPTHYNSWAISTTKSTNARTLAGGCLRDGWKATPHARSTVAAYAAHQASLKSAKQACSAQRAYDRIRSDSIATFHPRGQRPESDGRAENVPAENDKVLEELETSIEPRKRRGLATDRLSRVPAVRARCLTRGGLRP